MQDVLSDEFSVTTTEPHSVGFLIEQYDDKTLTLRSSQEHGAVTVGQLLNKITVVVKDKSSRLIEDVDVDTLQDAGLGFVVLAQTARFDNDYYKNMMLVVTSGRGVPLDVISSLSLKFQAVQLSTRFSTYYRTSGV